VSDRTEFPNWEWLSTLRFRDGYPRFSRYGHLVIRTEALSPSSPGECDHERRVGELLFPGESVIGNARHRYNERKKWVKLI
jgi:hypothetical protein